MTLKEKFRIKRAELQAKQDNMTIKGKAKQTFGNFCCAIVGLCIARYLLNDPIKYTFSSFVIGFIIIGGMILCDFYNFYKNYKD